MAEIQQSARPAGKNQRSASAKPRAAKRSFRLDMTPMVDLAFLLLTFFMLTTTFAKPNVMALNMPVDSPDKSVVPLTEAMTILLGKDHRVFYYFGLNAPADKSVAVPELHATSFAANGIRQALLARLRQQPATVVLIKPTPDAQYRDMVDILDEMTITNQKKYALVQLSKDDSHLLQTAAL
ncbi:biopolymer transporter ExbD [Hymenobacter sp. ASUV-10]|uniref:Biopolymer transporter ExbD n=1 Tax=Hymenobacter aranciens TaxID=3063996 RepID=A0ABT9BAF1_9BACT|nr:biopolymer transporter ExbD [Hymenobacter sp. ASUV-10]MDO7875208.1 biopolymer transporter ExbD [Hymenobacter sp. ASUV-10]